MEEEHTNGHRPALPWTSWVATHPPSRPSAPSSIAPSTRHGTKLCAALLHRSYPRLTRPPLNLQADELLGAVVERLLKGAAPGPPGDGAPVSSPWPVSTCGGNSMKWPVA